MPTLVFLIIIFCSPQEKLSKKAIGGWIKEEEVPLLVVKVIGILLGYLAITEAKVKKESRIHKGIS